TAEPVICESSVDSKSWTDIYEITVPKERMTNLFTTSPNASLDIDLQLLSSDFSILSESKSVGANETINYSLTPGTYYVKVGHYTGLGEYTLQWNQSLNAQDLAPPAINLSDDQNYPYILSDSNVSIVITDYDEITEVLYNWNNTTNATINLESPEIIAPSEEDSHVLYVYASDILGNWNIENFTFIVDSTDPTVTLSTFNREVEKGTTFGLELNVTDNYGIDTIRVHVDGNLIRTLTSEPYSFSINTTGMNVGEHILAIYVYDYAGNEDSLTETFTVVDKPDDETSFWELIAGLSSGVFGVAGYTLWYYKKLRYRKPFNEFKESTRLFKDVKEIAKKYKINYTKFEIYIKKRGISIWKDDLS
ncbi:MAG: hypothetical protein H7641_10045, partial [Candidatus Heimdallarchaeota archaeon]|nr:hypothetical protein [Candidatus Heimdallarchaeota archaeon]MCK4877903.1 hypothetical protein [Candidatus Heimdallarchaeota archaeon]